MPIRLAILLSFALPLAACDDPIEPRDEETPPVGPTASELSRESIIALADARSTPEAFSTALASPDVAHRRLAAISLSRLHDLEAVSLLGRALRDPDPEVRRNAALGLGALEHEAPPEAERLVLAALAAEEVRENQAAYLWDLGRIAGEGALGGFREALASDSPELREAACRGLAGYGLRRRPLSGALLRRVAARGRDDRQVFVRLACVYALSRVEPPSDEAERHGIQQDLVAPLSDPEAAVRVFAIRALGAYSGAESVLAARATDPDWQVAVHAFRALGRTVAEDRGRLASQALRHALDAALDDGEVSATEAHVLVTGFESLAVVARFEPVFAISREAHDRLGEPDGRPLGRPRGLSHCHAAALVDRGRGWPNAVDACGLEQVGEDERRLLAIEVLKMGEGSDAERGAYLRRLHGAGGARVKEAVLAAIPDIDEPGLWDLVLSDLGSDDPGVVIAACDAVEKLSPIWAETVGGDEPVLSIRPAGEPIAAQPTPHRRGPAISRIHRGLDRARNTLVTANDLEGLQSWMRAIRAAGDQGFTPTLRTLAAHSNPTIRAVAQESLPELADIPAPAPVPNPIDADSIPLSGRIRAEIRTEAGDIVAELDAIQAPTTVARFMSLAREGFFDGLSFHRVVAGFVVQGGDPRGDGYGGPGWSQRCEDNRSRYERGTLGMALAGRDTGGSQFFITHSPQPHLEGRYTAFGSVVEGLELVDQLMPGARIIAVEVAD
jgi:cyclophilin family peptidyl-prolyl cis-trans isomerase/HEAT repeat protein